MPYRPEELVRKQDEKVKADVDRLVKAIDDAMLRNYAGGEFRYSVGAIGLPVYRALDDAYRAAGWMLRKEADPDPRESGYILVFTPHSLLRKD
jgi:hypothetical protein